MIEQSHILEFARDVRSQASAVLNIEGYLLAAHFREVGRYHALLEELGTPVEGRPETYQVEGVYENSRIRNQERVTEQLESARRIAPRALFINLLASFETLVGALIRHYAKEQPSEFIDADATYAYQDVVRHSTLDGFRESVVEAKIEWVLRKSPVDLFRYLRNEHKMKIDLARVWPRFAEVTERRNCYAHNGGRVSAQYLTNTHAAGYRHAASIAVGDDLPMSVEYFTHAMEVVLEVGLSIAILVIRHFEGPSGADTAMALATDVAVDMMKVRESEAALNILRFASTHLWDDLDAASRMTSQLNIAQGEKWAGRSSRCLEILDGYDWNGADAKYRFVALVLRDEFDAAEELMSRACGEHADCIPEAGLVEWPIFREFRKTAHFRRGFEAAFGRAPHPGLLEAPRPQPASSSEQHEADDSFGDRLAIPLDEDGFATPADV